LKFNLQDSVDYILNSSNPPALRAVELFTFLIVLHLGRPTRKISGRNATYETSSLILEVSAKTVVNARMLAAMKFLDRVEHDYKKGPVVP
jgi:hypothetical protein